MFYYDLKDLRKFGNIIDWSEELGIKFFDYYGKVFEEGVFFVWEKLFIVLVVVYIEMCFYCIDVYIKDGL